MEFRRGNCKLRLRVKFGGRRKSSVLVVVVSLVRKEWEEVRV